MVKNKHIYVAKIIDFKFIIILKKKKKRVIFEIMSFKIFITKYFNMYWGEEKKKHLQISIKKKWYNFSLN